MAAEEKEEFVFDVNKEKNFSEWYTQILKKADVVDQRYHVKGFIVHKPLAAVCERLMYRTYEKKLEEYGHKLVVFPSVIPEENFKMEAEHVEGFAPEVFWITHGGKKKLEEQIALRPTSETAMYRMYSTWIRSWRDLPLKLYQSCQVWRHETKHTRPLLRDREFYWLEAHDVFATKAEAEKQVLEDMKITEEVLHDEFALPFFFFKRPEWDKFPGAVYTFGSDAVMPNKIVIQLPSTHLLGQNFSKPFNVKFVDKDEKEQYAWQTCYGPCISRILAALMIMHGDSKGLKFPWSVAPYQVVIIPIFGKGKDSEVKKKGKELLEKLRKLEIRAEFDDADSRPGAKYYYWELRGACLRFEIGANELAKKEITLNRRDTGKRETIKEKDLEEYLAGINKTILANLRKEADAHFKTCINDAKDFDDIGKGLEKGVFVRVMFCSRDMEGKACADKIAEKFQAEVRGTLHDKKEKPSGKCIVCGKPAKEVSYIAKAY